MHVLYIADLTGNGDALDVLGALVRVEVQRLLRCEGNLSARQNATFNKERPHGVFECVRIYVRISDE